MHFFFSSFKPFSCNFRFISPSSFFLFVLSLVTCYFLSILHISCTHHFPVGVMMAKKDTLIYGWNELEFLAIVVQCISASASGSELWGNGEWGRSHAGTYIFLYVWRHECREGECFVSYGRLRLGLFISFEDKLIH